MYVPIKLASAIAGGVPISNIKSSKFTETISTRRAASFVPARATNSGPVKLNTKSSMSLIFSVGLAMRVTKVHSCRAVQPPMAVYEPNFGGILYLMYPSISSSSLHESATGMRPALGMGGAVTVKMCDVALRLCREDANAGTRSSPKSSSHVSEMSLNTCPVYRCIQL